MKLILILLIGLLSLQAQAQITTSDLMRHGIAIDAASAAINYLNKNTDLFPNQKWLSIIDYRLHSSQKRYFLINTLNRKVYSFVVAHGKGSDNNHDGYADKFSNRPDSLMSSLGYYRVSEAYIGKHGLSVHLDGLSRTNSKARDRSVVIHGADYVKKNAPKQGRSWGCPAIEHRVTSAIIKRIKGGSLLLAFY